MNYPNHKSGTSAGKMFVCNKNVALNLLERTATSDRRQLQGHQTSTWCLKTKEMEKTPPRLWVVMTKNEMQRWRRTRGSRRTGFSQWTGMA